MHPSLSVYLSVPPGRRLSLLRVCCCGPAARRCRLISARPAGRRLAAAAPQQMWVVAGDKLFQRALRSWHKSARSATRISHCICNKNYSLIHRCRSIDVKCVLRRFVIKKNVSINVSQSSILMTWCIVYCVAEPFSHTLKIDGQCCMVTL